MYQHFRPMILGALIAALVSFVAWIGYTANHASHNADRARRDVKVLRQASPCLAAKQHPTKKSLARCHQSFGQAVALVTPLQACQLIRKGAAVLVIDGQRVKGIECLPKRVSKEQDHSPETDNPSPHSQPSGSNTESAIKHEQAESPKHVSSKPKQHKPSSSTQTPSSAATAAPPTQPDGPGNSEKGQGKAKGQTTIGVEVLPPGQVGKVEAEHLPIEICGPLVSVNC